MKTGIMCAPPLRPGTRTGCRALSLGRPAQTITFQYNSLPGDSGRYMSVELRYDLAIPNAYPDPLLMVSWARAPGPARS